jgi:hypothetical protein
MLIYVNITVILKKKIEYCLKQYSINFDILNYLIRNSQEICKIPKPKIQTKTQTLGLY